MSLSDSLFHQMPIGSKWDSHCWLWLAALRCGAVVQMTLSPASDHANAERIARSIHGAALVRVVPVPGAGRLLRRSEIQWALSGLGMVQLEAMAPPRWLARVAWLLDCSPRQLAASGALTSEDAGECSTAAPHLAAELIQACGWRPPPPDATTERPPPPGSTAPHSAQAWRAARDAYIGHILECRTCIAHRLRNPVYCAAGASLRRGYDKANEERP